MEEIAKKKRGRPKSLNPVPKSVRDMKYRLRRKGLLGRAFCPSDTQRKFLEFYFHYFQENKGVEKRPIDILREDLGLKTTNWQAWQRQAGFTDWYLKQKDAFHSTIGVSDVHDRIYEQALKDSSADRKLHLERFDPKYKPKNEQTFTFVGSRPIEMSDEQVQEMSKKRIESIQETVG